MKPIEWDEVEGKLLDENYPNAVVENVLPKLKRIDELRRKKNAVILAHYYQTLPIQLIADFAGDSLALAQQAGKLKDADLVVSSTVHFMAEMVKLLSPDKKIVIPAPDASCSIAEGMNGSTLKRMREVYPKCAIVGYINSTAEVKANLDSTCTSANAVDVVKAIKGDPVILVPDHFFFENIVNELNDGRSYLIYRRIENGNIVMLNSNTQKEITIELGTAKRPQLNKGICVVHEEFSAEQVAYYRKRENVDLVLAHPEVKPEVAAVADKVGGTGKMIKFVKTTDAKNILYLSECDLAAPLMKAYPNRKFVTPCVLCKYMKRNSIDGLLDALENETYEVIVDPKIAQPARKSMEKMFELTQ